MKNMEFIFIKPSEKKDTIYNKNTEDAWTIDLRNQFSSENKQGNTKVRFMEYDESKKYTEQDCNCYKE